MFNRVAPVIAAAALACSATNATAEVEYFDNSEGDFVWTPGFFPLIGPPVDGAGLDITKSPLEQTGALGPDTIENFIIIGSTGSFQDPTRIRCQTNASISLDQHPQFFYPNCPGDPIDLIQLMRKFPVGSHVGPDSEWDSSAIWGISSFFETCNSFGAGYIGIRLDSPEGTRYGWVEVDDNMNALAWAYETVVDTPIEVGPPVSQYISPISQNRVISASAEANGQTDSESSSATTFDDFNERVDAGFFGMGLSRADQLSYIGSRTLGGELGTCWNGFGYDQLDVSTNYELTFELRRAADYTLVADQNFPHFCEPSVTDIPVITLSDINGVIFSTPVAFPPPTESGTLPAGTYTLDVLVEGGQLNADGYADLVFQFAVTPVDCICETAGDLNAVTIEDLLAYIADFFAGDLIADVNGDLIVNIDDLLAFIACWFDAQVAVCL